FLVTAASAFNPVPHSFPTRRPSDLELVGVPPFEDHLVTAGITHRDALGLDLRDVVDPVHAHAAGRGTGLPVEYATVVDADGFETDRKSTRLNSSHVKISYAVFCLKK